MKAKSKMPKIFKNQIMIPLVALLLLALFNLIMDPTFFKISLGENSAGFKVLSGNIITILDCGTELAILAIGMTLVTAASGGQDISVGASIAIAGSVILRIITGKGDGTTLANPIWIAFIVALLVSMAFGAFNGILVALFKIQPMIATLILFTAGRSIAAWINNNELPTIKDKSYEVFGAFIPGIPIPTPIFIAIICFIITFLVMKFTSLGLFVQSVGINEKSSRVNGLNPEVIKILSFVILGACVAVGGLIKTSRTMTINYSVIAKDIEMDAILAVAIGGNALSGGKFSIPASVLGAYVIQALSTTLYKYNVPSTALSAYKAVVVILLVVFSSNTFRNWVSNVIKAIKKKEVQDGQQ